MVIIRLSNNGRCPAGWNCSREVLRESGILFTVYRIQFSSGFLLVVYISLSDVTVLAEKLCCGTMWNYEQKTVFTSFEEYLISFFSTWVQVSFILLFEIYFAIFIQFIRFLFIFHQVLMKFFMKYDPNTQVNFQEILVKIQLYKIRVYYA